MNTSNCIEIEFHLSSLGFRSSFLDYSFSGQQFVGFEAGFVGSTETIPKSSILTIVVDEQLMMDRMVTSAVDDSSTLKVDLIVDRNRPKVDKNEEHHEQLVVNRKEQSKDIIRNALCPPIERVERVRAERRGVAEAMVRLVDVLVKDVPVQRSVDEVDQHVCEQKKERNRE